MKKRISALLLAAFLLLLAACGKQTTVPYPTEAHEHVWGSTYVVTPATCQTAGETVRYCKICHAELVQSYTDPDAHVFEDEVIPPTERDEGYTVRTCTLCGTVYARENVVPARYTLLETEDTETALPEGATALMLSDTETHQLYHAACGDLHVNAEPYRRLALALTVGEIVTTGGAPAGLARQLELWVYDGSAAAANAICSLLDTTEAALIARVNARMEALGVTGAELTSLTAAENFGTATLTATARVFARVLDEPTVCAALVAAVPPVKAIEGFETRAVIEAGDLRLSAVAYANGAAFLAVAGSVAEATVPALYRTLPAV